MIERYITDNKIPKFRLGQFYQAYYREFADSFDEITTWPLDLRKNIASLVDLPLLSVKTSIVSGRGDTVKVLFQRKKDGSLFESVLMRHRDGRNTVCVSCMVGCPVGCAFCATGRMGFRSNLTADEIVAQVVHFGKFLKKENRNVTNIVFMGMGEPMLNLTAVCDAIGIISDPEKMNFSMRRITVSTSGYAPQLQKFIRWGYKGRLALSLHAPFQTLRNMLMPGVSKYPLESILSVLDDYAAETNKRISYEYILLDGINDLPKHAKALADLMQGRLAHINLIPYNPVPGKDFKRSSERSIRAFSHILSRNAVPHTVRVTFGDDIQAACGQLANGS